MEGNNKILKNEETSVRVLHLSKSQNFHDTNAVAKLKRAYKATEYYQNITICRRYVQQ